MNDAEAMALDFATLIRLGGPVAVILIALSVVALAMSLYKIIQFAIIRVGRHKPALFAMDKWFDGERDDAYEHIMNHRAPLSRVMAHAMRGVTHSGIHLDTVKEDTTRVALEELRTLRKYLRGLELISQTAPLLGLFGTVVGMIQAFSQLQASGAAVNPAALAGGIWTALLATALGLAVAIVFSTITAWLESRVENERSVIETTMTGFFAHRITEGQDRSFKDVTVVPRGRVSHAN